MKKTRNIPPEKITCIPLLAILAFLLILVSSVHAAPSVDLTLTPLHLPSIASGQPPVYSFGEPVAVNVTLTNQGSDPVTVMGFLPKRGISQRNQTDFLIFPRSSDTVTIGPGRTLSFNIAWDQKNAHGVQVDAGLYTIAVYYLLSEDTGGDLDFSHVEPYSCSVDIVILPEGGALIADIPVNQTQVMDNLSVTLEAVHLTNTSGQVTFTFQVPEDIPYQTHPAGWKMCYLDFLSIEGAFSIDHTTPRQFFYNDVNCEPPHLFRSTYELDLIPAGAQEMEINLTVSGTHQGSSIFHVNLTPYSTASGNGTGSSYSVSPTKPAPLPVTLVILAMGCIPVIAAIRKQRRSG